MRCKICLIALEENGIYLRNSLFGVCFECIFKLINFFNATRPKIDGLVCRSDECGCGPNDQHNIIEVMT